MNARDLQGILPAIIKSRVSTIIWGRHGIGKSQILRSVAEDLYGKTNPKQHGGGPTLIDLRLGQLEIGDLTGIPRNIESEGITQTIWGLPEWWPHHEKSNGILFLDEMNRAATPDVLQASFQLVLDHRLHTHALPKGWTVIAACNPEDGDYQVMRFDPALMDRFLHLVFKPTTTDWVTWAEKHLQDTKVRDFAIANKKVLNLDQSAPEITVQSSPRSIELLARIFAVMTDAEKKNYGSMIASGLIGTENTILFKKFMDDNMENPVEPSEILNNWEKVKPRISKWVRGKSEKNMKNTRADLLKAQWDLVVTHIKVDLKGKITEDQASNIVDFMFLLPTDIAMTGVNALAGPETATVLSQLGEMATKKGLMNKLIAIMNPGQVDMKEGDSDTSD